MDLGVLQTLINMNNLVLNNLKTANKDTIEQIYILNQDLTPMVGSLNSSNELKDLIDMSSHSFYIEKKSELVAFDPLNISLPAEPTRENISALITDPSWNFDGPIDLIF